MLTFVFLSEGDVRVHKTASNAMGGGGGSKKSYIYRAAEVLVF